MNFIFVSQDVTDDVLGAIKAGLQGYLVQTGKYTKGDETKINPSPTQVVRDFPEAVEKILEQIKNIE